ncbi:MAG TPA: GNAT family N-acetyltransferase [Jatrophihabitans sp.]|nr:GNAT family N-acetyltransferase [Jatrophihabitans sp.]
MPVTATADHAQLAEWLGRFLARDPVRGTLLGTVRAALGPGAWGAIDGGDCLAVRSGSAYPVVIVGDWPGAHRAELRGLLAGLPQVAAVAGPAPVVIELAADLPGRPHTMAQALHRLDELREPPPVPGRAAPAVDAERPLLRAWFAAFLADVFEEPRPGDTTLDSALDQRHCWLWRDVDDRPVSMACRRPAFNGSARIGPVYTPPQHRGHGYGSAVTAAATRDVLAEGAVPVLFTDLANPTSNKIYRELGYYVIDERIVISFK